MQIAVNGRNAISKKEREREGGGEREREICRKRESDVFIYINSISVLA